MIFPSSRPRSEVMEPQGKIIRARPAHELFWH